MRSSEVDMSRYNIDEVEMTVDDQILDGDSRRPDKGDADQPKRSPIRRKNKFRQEAGMKPKTKRNHKKIQHRLKYDWQKE